MRMSNRARALAVAAGLGLAAVTGLATAAPAAAQPGESWVCDFLDTSRLPSAAGFGNCVGIWGPGGYIIERGSHDAVRCRTIAPDPPGAVFGAGCRHA
ncbi:hypothetical protein [Marinactinospora rubrisoli]|uniref:Uncharacterized protein n=1 Tax=Marinactinospora rubrisoli TaxID=2715399 RepID=A0ABW2KAT1_9ACTN